MRTSLEALIVTFRFWSLDIMARNAGMSLSISVEKFGDRKPMAVNDWSNQRSSYDNARSAALELSVQNYFSRLHALHSFYSLDVARSIDASLSYAPNGYGFLQAPVRFDFSLVSLCMSTLKWQGCIIVRTLAYSSYCFLSPLCTGVCVFVCMSKRNFTRLINTVRAINILHILCTRHRACLMLRSALYMLDASRGGAHIFVWLHFVRSLLVSRCYM